MRTDLQILRSIEAADIIQGSLMSLYMAVMDEQSDEMRE